MARQMSGPRAGSPAGRGGGRSWAWAGGRDIAGGAGRAQLGPGLGGEARGGRWAGGFLWGRGQSAGGTGPYRSVGEGGLWAGRTHGGPAGAISGPSGAAGKQKRERIRGRPSADVQALSIL
jgi:hypothetical protein